MEKRKITVLVNAKTEYKSYVTFLSEKYIVSCIDCKEYSGEKIDLMLFTGGEDVNPMMYGENQGKYTHINQERDKIEYNYMFNRMDFEGKHIPKLGICRGAQFLTVKSGGKLIQDVENHAINGLHALDMKYSGINGLFKITSTHHQMMYPYILNKKKYKILATSTYFLSGSYLNGNDEEIDLDKDFEECEIVFYPDTNSLCIQGHPESFNCPLETKKECLNLIEQYLKV